MRHLTLRTAEVSAALIGLALASPAAAVTFADGAVHVIDSSNSFPLESAVVDDGPGPTTTTVNLVTGGEIAPQGGSGLEAFGTSQVNVSGGSLGGFLVATDDSQVSISATGTANTFGIQATGRAHVTLSDGRVGQIGGPLTALDLALIEIVGSGFNLPLGDIVALSGMLTGVLADGTPISTSFGRASTARISLVPEPASAVLLAAGLAATRRQDDQRWRVRRARWSRPCHGLA
jgi:hypothetical protein